MGLFSGSDKTYVSTTTNRLVEDKKFISSVKSGTVKSVFAKSSATVDYIMEDLVNGLGFTAKKFYKFGRDHYPYGLPSATGVSEQGGGKVVQEYLKLHTTVPDPIVYKNYIGIYNYWHAAFTYIDSQYALNPKTGELVNLTNIKTGGQHKVYITEMYLMMNQATYDSIPPDSLLNKSVKFAAIAMDVQVSSGIPNNQIRVFLSYGWDTGNVNNTGGGEGGPLISTPIWEGDTVYPTENFFNPAYNPGDQYFHTIYEDKLNNNFGWFTYRIGSGGDFKLDNVYNPAVNDVGSYFPWTYFRYNKVKGNEDKNDPGYLAAKKMLKKINLKYDDICDNIHENPDIADVEQAMMIWAIEADSQNKLDQRYLYEYFDNTFVDSGGMPYDLSHEDLADPYKVANLINNSALVIQDARFKMGLSNMGMYKRAFAGSIGPVGAYSSGELDLFFEYQYTQDSEGGAVTSTFQYPVPSHFYRKQVSPGWYEEILVMGLAVQYHIWGDYQVTANGDTADDRFDLLLIPLDLAVTKEFSLLQREELYSRSLYFVFNARVTVHLKWYQSDFFQFLMIVVSIAIMLYTGMDTFTGFLAATATMTATQILMAVLLTGLEYLITAIAFKLFIKVVGVKLAFIVAIIGMAYGMTAQMGDKLGMELSKEMPFAGDLLKVSTGLGKAVKSEVAGDMAGMQKELADMQTDLKALGVQIKTVEDEMAENSTYAAYIPLTAEEPEDFFNRTIHAGNIGMIGIDAVSNYVERSLMLPLPQPFGELV
jgi:hypothetical protein